MSETTFQDRYVLVQRLETMYRWMSRVQFSQSSDEVKAAEFSRDLLSAIQALNQELAKQVL